MGSDWNPDLRTGNRWIIIGGLVIMCAFLGAIFVPVYRAAQPAPPGASCLGNLKQLGLATSIYMYDTNDRLPPGGWMDAIAPYVKVEYLFTCPSVKKPLKYGYAYQLKLVGRPIGDFKEEDILYFETDALGKNVVTNLSAGNSKRHKRSPMAVRMDGAAIRFLGDRL